MIIRRQLLRARCYFETLSKSPAHTSQHALAVRTLQSRASIISRDPEDIHGIVTKQASKTTRSVAQTGLEKLPTFNIIRTLLLGSFFSSQITSKIGFSILSHLAASGSFWTSPDRNPVIRAVVKPLLYDQFCAGTSQREIEASRALIRRIGYAGVILCYGKENTASASKELRTTGSASSHHEIEQWRDGNLKTIAMVSSGDWIGVKFTGAGAAVTEALLKGEAPSDEFCEAFDAICRNVAARDCRLWVDAEQTVFQGAIDKWALMFMRKHNINGRAVVYNTIQAYLKASREKLRAHLALAEREGWQLAVKLVRGAYIADDSRELIHNTKQDTDESYNGIVRDILTGKNLGFDGRDFPSMQLFLAGHNPESVRLAWNLMQTLSTEGTLNVVPDFGQLQGMADELGCKVLKQCEDLARGQKEAELHSLVIPKVYKCLTWGSVQECMQYLLRRITENKGGVDRMKDGMAAHWAELKRRLFQWT